MLSTQRVCSRRLSWQTAQRAARLVVARNNTSLASGSSVEDDEASTPLSTFDAEDAGEEDPRPESYSEFMKAIGNNFRRASPQNWLGGEVPFPMNPSFLPPAPISDAVRTRIYQEFMRDPTRNSVRALSQRYHISLKRVDAILRLKGLENAWVKQGKQLQTGFQQGMEKLLGVKSRKISDDWTRHDVHEADILEQDENRDAARQRYQRLYWESIPESRGEPIVPAALEHAREHAKRIAARAEGLDSNLKPRIKDTEHIKTPHEKVQVIIKPAHPTFEFRDVGSKFLDPNERLHRIAVAERRARVKRDKRAGKERN
ncbi:hypothetical protein APHAL10511_005981 [Amanita phalloides]|nr:hypothetical protein APHAL10511_005981 [Amanita phalloides]